MNDNLNIENLFSDSFNGFKIEPRSNVWEGISRQLWKRRFGDFFKTSFEGYKVEPATYVWNKIARRLWFYNFIKFNPASFNIYYFGLALSVITAAIVMNTENNKNGNSKLNNQSISSNIISHNSKENSQLSANQTLDSRSEINTSDITNNKNDKKQTNTVTETVSENKEIKKTVANNRIQKNNKNHANASNNTVINQLFTKQAQQTNKTEEPVFTASANAPETAVNALATPFDSKNALSLLLPKLGLLALSLPQENLKPDTLGLNIFGAPIIFGRTHWSVDAWISPMFNKSNFGAKNNEFNSYSDNLNANVSDAVTYKNAGIDLNFSYKNWIVQLGVSYLEFGQKMNAPNTVTELQPKSVYSYMETHRFVSDTIWFIDLDSLIHSGDTVWVPGIINQEWKIQKDSILGTSYDTLKTTSRHSVTNRYSYIEIPLMAGYEFKQNKFSYTLKGGIAAGFFLKSNGSFPMASGNDSYNVGRNNMPYAIPNFSMIFSIGINYHFNNKFAIFGEPYIRKSINSIFDNGYSVSQKFQSTGVKFGVRYTFK